MSGTPIDHIPEIFDHSLWAARPSLPDAGDPVGWPLNPGQGLIQAVAAETIQNLEPPSVQDIVLAQQPLNYLHLV